MAKPKHNCKLCGFSTNNLLDEVGFTGLIKATWICPACLKKMIHELEHLYRIDAHTWLYKPPQMAFEEARMFKYHDRSYPVFARANWDMWARGRVSRRP